MPNGMITKQLYSLGISAVLLIKLIQSIKVALSTGFEGNFLISQHS
jgi:hypothetical protein